MKKKLVLFTFLLLLLSPIFTFTNAFASEEGLTINGGSYSSGSSHSPTSERLRIAFSRNWKVKEPGASSIVLNDMRSNKTIKKNEAALYLSGEALDARLINRNSSTSLLNEVEIRKKLTNGATSIISKIDIINTSEIVVIYKYIDNMFLTRTATEKLPILLKYIKPKPGHIAYQSPSSGNFYTGNKGTDVWISWSNKAFPMSSNPMPLKKWSNSGDWSKSPLSNYANMSLWTILTNGLAKDDFIKTAIRPIVAKTSGSLIYGDASGALQTGVLTVNKVLSGDNISDIGKNTNFQIYVKNNNNEYYSGKEGRFVTSTSIAGTVSVNRSLVLSLPYGTYTIKEAPAINVKNTPYSPEISYTKSKVTLSASNKEESITVTNKFTDAGSITIKKKLGPGYELAGITNTTNFKFKIKGPDGYIKGSQNNSNIISYSDKGQGVDTFEFSEMKSARVIGLPIGTYTIEEVDLPDNCTPDYSSAKAELLNSRKSSSVTVKNDFLVNTGTIEIKKIITGLPTAEVTQNTEYKVSILNTKTNKYLSVKGSGTTYTAEGFSNSKKYVNIRAARPTVISKVPVGKYKIIEEAAGFTPKYSKETLVVVDNAKSSITIENVYDGAFSISKELVNPPTGIDNNTIFTGKLFINGTEAKFVQSDGKYKYSPTGTVNQISFSVDSPAFIEDLPSGNITFQETMPDIAPNFISYNDIKSNGVTAGIRVVNTYSGIPEMPGDPPGPNIPSQNIPPVDSPLGEEHPCEWENPPDEVIETKLSLVYVNVDKYSDRETTSETLLDRTSSSAEALFNNPTTSINYDYISKEHEHDLVLGVISKQVVVEKHTWYTLTPGWHCPEFDKFEHGDGIGEYDGWQHPGGHECLTCGKDEHSHGTECYNDKGELVCEKEEHSHTGECYTKYPCTHPKRCHHVIWKYPPPELPQWTENVEYRIRDERIVSSYPDYYREIPQLTYKYFYPYNIITKAPETNTIVSSYLGNTTSQPLEINSNLYNSNVKNGALVGINNNSPIPFTVYFGNEQFGIPDYGDGFHIENSLIPPAEGVYDYEEQYYWNGKLYFGALDNSRIPTNTYGISIASLEYDGLEKSNLESPWVKMAHNDFTSANFLYRSIKTTGDNRYLLGANNMPFWYAEFDYGLRYRYGIRYDIDISVGTVGTPIRKYSWTTKHATPPTTSFKSSSTNPIISVYSSMVDDVWTGENHSRINAQPIIYGEIDIKTVAGYNK